MIEKLAAATQLATFFVRPERRLLGFYYDQHPNVGDVLNVDLADRLLDKELVMLPGMRHLPHVLMVGSILGQMNKNSIVWGSGVLSPEIFDQCHGLGTILAVRGRLTKGLIEKKFDVQLDCPLGDPGLLLPRVYPMPQRSEKQVGIIPHLLDESSDWVRAMCEQGAKLVSVSLPPEQFVDALADCSAVISSSLHGLILADAYNIPNIRFSLPNPIPGGDFKFDDYYSATTVPLANEDTIRVEPDDTRRLVDLIAGARVKPYAFDLDDLLAAAPRG